MLPIRSLLAASCLAAALAVASDAVAASECLAPATFGPKDRPLQSELLAGLRGARLGDAIARRQLAVSLVDLTRGRDRFYAGVNDDFMMYAASLPKIAILLAVIDAVDRGEHPLTDDMRFRLSQMITISNNTYATWGAELVGLRAIARVMLDPRFCLYEGGVGGLWVGRGFRKGGEEFREPLKGLSHAATSRQTARFYTLLEDGALVSPAWSAEMRRWMGPPLYIHKFVKALRSRPGVTFPARKSGTWANFHADSALIEHGANRFILVGLADHADGGEWLQRVARVAHDLIREGRHRRRVHR